MTFICECISFQHFPLGLALPQGRMRYWKASVVPMLLLFHAVPVVSLTPDERARDLVSNMTYKEKFKLIHGVGLRVSFMGPSGGTPSIWRLKIPGKTVETL